MTPILKYGLFGQYAKKVYTRENSVMSVIKRLSFKEKQKKHIKEWHTCWEIYQKDDPRL